MSQNVYTITKVENISTLLFICPDCNGLNVFQPKRLMAEKDIKTFFLLFMQKIFPEEIWEYQDEMQFYISMLERGTLSIHHG